jgi:hypothetical protein
MSQRTPWLRIAIVSLPPLLASLWLTLPPLQPKPREVAGPISRAEVCLGLCGEVLAIDTLRLACRFDFSGVPHGCPERLAFSGPAKVTYAALPSVTGVLGLSPVDGVLLEVQAEDRVVFSRPLEAQVWMALYGGWVFNAIYWPLAGLVIWRWPNSRFSRRVQWKDET